MAMVTAIAFVNFTSQKFSWTWDSVEYSFEPGQRYVMEDWKARHFAKHLVNHVLNKAGKSVMDQSRAELLSKALPEAVPVVEAPESQIETKLMNQEGPKPKKAKAKKGQEPGTEGEFDGVQ